MKNFVLSILALLLGFSLTATNRNKKEKLTDKGVYCTHIHWKTTPENPILFIDSITINRFFKKYPNLKTYKPAVTSLYKKRNYNTIWYNKKGLIEFANLLYAKVNGLENEGLKSNLAYKNKIDTIFNTQSSSDLSPTDKEILLSTMYIFYAKNVFQGIDTDKIKETGWLLPRKNLSYVKLLDSLLVNPNLLNKNENHLFEQYYKLRDALIKYRQIEKNNDWNPIETNPSIKEYRPGDNSKTIGQIRHRLAVTGDLKYDSKSNFYDEELMAGILNFKKRNGYKPDYIIGSQHINRMNIPISTYIKTIMLNMERCRWIPPELPKANEFIVINIPAFKLIYKKNGGKALESKVFVGINLLETVIFSSNINRLVFSPYWNAPRSIIENELKPAIDKDPNYLADNDLEWNGGNIRQKPGKKNVLGMVKFVFPNPYDIYLHDTPFKGSFDSDFPTFSHGCINMQKAKELVLLILKDDPDWPIERINESMKGVKETTCVLKKKIPIHIAYFTAWVYDSGEINFYFDIYQKDNNLAELLFPEDSD